MTPRDEPGRRFLTEAAFEDEDFTGLELAGADLTGKDLYRCRLRQVRAGASRWDRTRMEDCTFEGSDLERIQLPKVALRGVAFIGCRLTGTDWSGVAQNPSVSFEDCNLQYASFVGVNLARTRFRRCRLIEVNFIDSRLSDGDFSGSDLSGARFEHCDLQRTDFGDTQGAWFDPAQNKTKQTRINVAMAVQLATSLGLRVVGFSDEEHDRPAPPSARRGARRSRR